ncbi:MAG: hypothetical protein CUN55_14645 [Phototrophicales bacterium]|nr:MAG: hypothetical protein CUN55_14645 [Phototrophicales bacterium]
MPIQVAWEIPQLMLAVKLHGTVTVEDILQFMEAYYTARDESGNESLHLMLYIDEAESWPDDPELIKKEIASLPQISTKNYACILQGPVELYRLMQQVCFYMMALRYEGFPVREAALEFMRQIDPNIREALSQN